MSAAVQPLERFLRRHAEPDASGHVLRSPTPALLLPSTDDSLRDCTSPPRPQHAGPLWSMKLVTGETEITQRKVLDRCGHLANPLRPVRVAQHSETLAAGSNLVNGLDHPRLIVRPHHGHKRDFIRPLGQQRFQRRWIDPAGVIPLELHPLDAAGYQVLHELPDSRVLDFAGHHDTSIGPDRERRPNRRVDGLRPA